MSEVEGKIENDDDGEEFIVPGQLIYVVMDSDRYYSGTPGDRNADGRGAERFRDWAGLNDKSSSDPDVIDYKERIVYHIQQKFVGGKYLDLSVTKWDPFTCQGSLPSSYPFSISFDGPSYSQDMVWSRSPTFVPEADCFKQIEPSVSVAAFKEQSLKDAFDIILPVGLKSRLGFSGMDDEIAYEVLYSKLLNHPTITKIEFPGSDNFNLCCNLIINSDTLEEIFFQDIESLDEQMLQRLFESVKISRNLKALDLRTSRYLETWAKASSARRSNKPSILAEPVLAALKALEGCSECPLETLDFGGNIFVGSTSVGELMTTLLSSSLGLKRLSFRGCDLTDEELFAFAADLENNDRLESLDLSHNTISKEVMELLVKNKTLKELKLEHCKIDLEIVECLASSLPQIQRLRHLYLDGNEFTWEPLTEAKEAIGTIAMLEALEKNESLLSLEMGEFGMLARYGMPCCTSPPYNTTLNKENMAQLRQYLERNRKAGTALMKASSEGQTERVKELSSDMSEDIDIVDADGDTALMYASRSGHTEIVNLLSEMGSDINIANKMGDTALMLAYKKGQTETVRLLLNKGADLTIANNDGDTLLMWASENGQTDIVKYLPDKGAGINIANKREGNTALILAYKNGHTDTMRLLLEKGADVNIALILASENGHIEMVKLLSDLGANIDIAGRDGSTALALASENGHIEIVKLLSDLGANIDIAGRDGSTALTLASENGHIEIVKLLSDLGANIDIAGRYGSTALMLASKNGHIELVKLLSDWGANINSVSTGDSNALMLASKNGHIEIVKLLSDMGADLSVPDGSWLKTSALMLASEKGHTKIVKLLSDKGADIHATEELFGRTSLMFAVENGHVETVKHLLDMGADIYVANTKGQTALCLAEAEGHSDIVELLLESMCDPDTPLDWVKILAYSNKSSDEYESDEKGDDESSSGEDEEDSSEDESQYESGSDEIEENSDDESEYNESSSKYFCCFCCTNESEYESDSDDSDRPPPKKWKGGFSLSSVDIERVQSLLEHPKNEGIINWKNDSVRDGRTMLLSSIVYERWDVVELLLKHGADANIADKDGEVPLHRAIPLHRPCTIGHLETIESLIENGADPDIKDYEGMTSLHRACAKGSLEVVQLLLRLGVNANTKTNQGSTPLQVASERNHLKIVWFLVRQFPTLILEQLE